MGYVFLKYEFFRFPIELPNLFRRGLNIGNINISRCSKDIPDHSAAVVYPFVAVPSVRAGACLYNSLAASCGVYPEQQRKRLTALSTCSRVGCSFSCHDRIQCVTGILL